MRTRWSRRNDTANRRQETNHDQDGPRRVAGRRALTDGELAEPAAARDLRGRRPPPPRLRRGGRPATRRVVRRHPVPHRDRPAVRRDPPGVHPPVGHARRVDARRVRDPRRHRGQHGEHRARPVLRPRIALACTRRVDARRRRRGRPGGHPRHRHAIPTARPSPAPRWTAGRTPRPASTPSSSRASSRRRTCAASTRPMPTARTRSARSGRCRTRSPSTGRSVGCSRANGRGWMRPGHTHMWVRAEGLKDLITHVFDEESEYLTEDAVFGVRPSLVRRFAPTTTASSRPRSTSCSIIS